MSTLEKYNTPFATNLRTLLDKNSTTITALSKQLGLSRQAVSQYADGTGLPNAEKLTMIAKYFNVSTDWLLGLSDNPSIDLSEREMSAALGLSGGAITALKHFSGVAGKHKTAVLDELIAHPWILDTLHVYLDLDIDSIAKIDKNNDGTMIPKKEYEKNVALADSKKGRVTFTRAALLSDVVLLQIEGQLRELKKDWSRRNNNG